MTETNSNTMRVRTSRFGEIEVKKSSIIEMVEGMPGLEHCRRYVMVEDRPDAGFKWFQSVDDPAVAFIIINPMEFFQDYRVELSDEQAESLGLTDAADAAVFTTVTIDREGGTVTTNLCGPVVVNLKDMRAMQIISGDERYCTKHFIGRLADSQEQTLAKAA